MAGRIFLSPPHVGEVERRFLLEAFDSNWIAPGGPMVEAFEREFADKFELPFCVAVASGTAALHLCLREMGIGAGDTVVVSTFTFAAPAKAVAYCGATPVFVDSEPRSWNLDPGLLEQALRDGDGQGRLPKAVLVVDVYGQPADYDAIMEVAGRWGVPVIEDAAEALGARRGGRLAGTFGRAGIFSFNGNKVLTTGGGGMVVTADPDRARRVRRLSTMARETGVPHYEHRELGFGYGMNNLLAAIGRGQLRAVDERLAARRRCHDSYGQRLGDLPGLDFMPVPAGSEPSYWLTCLLVDPARSGTDRESVRQALELANIESRPLFKPMHLQPVFRGCRSYVSGVAEELFDRGLCLPSGSQLTEDDLERICGVIRGCFPAGA